MPRLNFTVLSQDTRLVVEKYKSGFQPPGDIPFDDLSSNKQSTLQAGGDDGGDRHSISNGTQVNRSFILAKVIVDLPQKNKKILM